MMHREDFTIHGLWPEYGAGRWPEYCDRSSQFNARSVEDLLPRMKQQWPSFAQGGYGFWAHEWVRHGTCAYPAITSQHDYFSRVLDLDEKYNLLVGPRLCLLSGCSLLCEGIEGDKLTALWASSPFQCALVLFLVSSSLYRWARNKQGAQQGAWTQNMCP